MNANRDVRRSATPSRRATRMRWLACSLALAIALALSGCAGTPKVTYLRATDRTVHLKSGECAPFEGWLLSDDRLAEIYDLLDERAPRTTEPPD
jgi:hypothetical protein